MSQHKSGKMIFVATYQYNFIQSLLESNIRMQDNSQSKGASGTLLRQLISKISRLRRILVSNGYSAKQVIDIVFIQFLGLPQIDWKKLQQTNNLYEVKAHFRVDTISAETIMRLQKLMPNLHTNEVCEQLLITLKSNASNFCLNLQQSSSQSNDSGSGMKRLIISKAKRRLKNSSKREQINQKRWNNKCQEQKLKKKVHHDLQYSKNKKSQQQDVIYFKSRSIQTILAYEDDQLQKQMKKMPESQDSQHQ